MGETRLTPEVELNGITPDEAFAILGDETRLEIVRVLWRAGALREYDELFEDEVTLTFSELQRLVGVADNGQFNYHLSKLVPHFVAHRPDGYRLSGAGKQLARTVIAVTGEFDPDLFTDLETACPICDGELRAGYEDQWLRYTCSTCPGEFGDSAPDGAIMYGAFPGAGVSDSSPEELLSTALYRCVMDLGYLMRGICRECTGGVESTVSICEDHASDGTDRCDACGTPAAVWVDLRCERCRFAKRLPIEACVLGLTPVIAFLYEREIDVLSPRYEDLVAADGMFQTSVSSDPTRISVTLSDGSAELALAFDETMNPLEVSPSG